MLQVIRTKMKSSWKIYGVKEAEVSLYTILGPQKPKEFPEDPFRMSVCWELGNDTETKRVSWEL
jgi:hypothetical protein